MQSRPNTVPRSEIYYHYGRTVTAIKEVICRSESYDLDAILAAMLCLMSIDVGLSNTFGLLCADAMA